MCASIQQLFTAGSEGRIMLCSNVVYSSMLVWMLSPLKALWKPIYNTPVQVLY